MHWKQLLSETRVGGSKEAETGRSQFHKDVDRIIFCDAFRRLAHKTQVHTLTENDHVHTRLTHSLEVASLGRSMGSRVGHLLQQQLPQNITPDSLGAIVQAAGLAHDIGNPPFGHAGENSIRRWFASSEAETFLEPLTAEQVKDLTTFEGNASGFRQLVRVEQYLDQGGIRLTAATLGASIKYPWCSNQSLAKGKFSIYQDEIEIARLLASDLGLIKESNDQWARHPLSFLMEAADDIGYAVMDLEDAVELGLLQFEELLPLFEDLLGKQVYQYIKKDFSQRRQLALMRGQAMELMVNEICDSFVAKAPQLLAGEINRPLIHQQSQNPASKMVLKMKQLGKEKVYLDSGATAAVSTADRVLPQLLQPLISAVYRDWQNQPLTNEDHQWLSYLDESVGLAELSLYQRYLRVMDFVGGSTDRFVCNLASKI
ncbi:deoxyguanosinetriphosphate triphosphohydrolase [Pelagibaculum spongiae]|uniref:Deoxyguanosinetriphosphate triphosphohydrolase n=1 Tax=Pelagibaculum spongiae TaxID=2080658 RepID=A0A2V1GSK7_9GAMM|nr:deoxyguanosinetriphosphate triphosphohydrolase [Pelagibaculum spongiae]PVZ67693.1 deoxyguanosinetriphosphate triphosphohydrolase [Pelagibaculum spongiae]